MTPDGVSLDTLCLIDQRPRALYAEQRQHVRAFAEQVMGHLQPLMTEASGSDPCPRGPRSAIKDIVVATGDAH